MIGCLGMPLNPEYASSVLNVFASFFRNTHIERGLLYIIIYYTIGTRTFGVCRNRRFVILKKRRKTFEAVKTHSMTHVGLDNSVYTF